VNKQKLCHSLSYGKGVGKMLMKLIPGVKFTNIYKQLLPRYSFAEKFQSQTVIKQKLYKSLLHGTAAHKMLVTLTRHLGLISSTCFTQSFYTSRSQKHKKTVNSSVSFSAFGIYARKSCV